MNYQLTKTFLIAAVATFSLTMEKASARPVECTKKTGAVQKLTIVRDTNGNARVQADVFTRLERTSAGSKVILESQPEILLTSTISGGTNMGREQRFEIDHGSKAKEHQIVRISSDVNYRYPLDDKEKHADQIARRIVTVTIQDGADDFQHDEIFVDRDCRNLRSFNQEKM